MTRVRRPSAQTTAVVLALAAKPTAWRYGYELCQQLDLKPGSMYPILMRLTDRGLRFIPLVGLPFAVIGATCGVHSARPPAAPAQHPAATIKL